MTKKCKIIDDVDEEEEKDAGNNPVEIEDLSNNAEGDIQFCNSSGNFRFHIKL